MLRDFTNGAGRTQQPTGIAEAADKKPPLGSKASAVTEPDRTLGQRLSVGAVIIIGAVALGGCGMSSLTSGMSGGMFGGATKQQAKGVSQEQLLSAAKADDAGATASVGDVAFGCPRFMVWPQDHHVTIYETGRVGDGMAVMHRGEITKTARECHVERGRVTVRYGFSGRVLLGPRGRAGSLALPVNVFVTDAKRERIATDKARVDVTVESDRPIAYFSIVRTVTFNVPEGTRPGEFDVYVGFDRTAPGAG